jgi:hypothetical protein
MLALEFPSHAAHILGGNRNGRRHGLLQGDDRGGSRETVDEAVCMSHLMHKEEERKERDEKGILISCCICEPKVVNKCVCYCAVRTFCAFVCHLGLWGGG